MKLNILHIAIKLSQIFLTSAILFVVYMLLALADATSIDFISMSFGFLFQSVFGFIIIAITICILLLIGAILKRIIPFWNWWKSHQWICIILILVSLILLALCILHVFTMNVSMEIDGAEQIVKQSNPYITISSWFVLSFCLLHFSPTEFFRSKDYWS